MRHEPDTPPEAWLEHTSWLTSLARRACVAGRIVALRRFGKAAFAHLQDSSGKIQVYLKKDLLPPEEFAVLRKLDIVQARIGGSLGDYVGTVELRACAVVASASPFTHATNDHSELSWSGVCVTDGTRVGVWIT